MHSPIFYSDFGEEDLSRLADKTGPKMTGCGPKKKLKVARKKRGINRKLTGFRICDRLHYLIFMKKYFLGMALMIITISSKLGDNGLGSREKRCIVANKIKMRQFFLFKTIVFLNLEARVLNCFDRDRLSFDGWVW